MIIDQVNIIKIKISCPALLWWWNGSLSCGLTPLFFYLEALVLMLPLLTPSQGARSMSLQENISPVHRPSNFKAKQRWGEKVYVVRWGRGREARPKMPESTYVLLKIRFSDHFLMNFWSLIRNIFWKIKNLKAILLQINYKIVFCFNISVSIIFRTIYITQTNLINT